MAGVLLGQAEVLTDLGLGPADFSLGAMSQGTEMGGSKDHHRYTGFWQPDWEGTPSLSLLPLPPPLASQLT